MRLLSRLLVVVGLLAVPLGLAVASQALADRPGAPSVPAESVVIEEAGPPPRDATDPTTPASPPSGPAAEPPRPDEPQVVDPAPIPVDDADDADDEADGADVDD